MSASLRMLPRRLVRSPARRGWGRIINISGSQRSATPAISSGGARNGCALVHLTKTLAVQMARHGITVNCIHPGTTRTERTPSLLRRPAPPSWAYPRRRRRSSDFAPDLCSRRQCHLPHGRDAPEGSPSGSPGVPGPRTRPGRSPANWSPRAGGRAVGDITERRPGPGRRGAGRGRRRVLLICWRLREIRPGTHRRSGGRSVHAHREPRRVRPRPPVCEVASPVRAPRRGSSCESGRWPARSRAGASTA